MTCRAKSNTPLRVFELTVVIPTIAVLAYFVAQDSGQIKPELALWAAIVAVVELIPVPLWRGTSVSMGFPLLMAVAFLPYSPVAAGVTAFVGAFDPREFRREYGPLRALFNRCQVALAVVAASLIFHSFADIREPRPLLLLTAAMVAAVADYVLNTTLVGLASSLYYGIPPLQAIRALKIGTPSDFFVSYVGLGVLGLIMAKFFSMAVGFWAIPIFVLPLLLARQMFFRSKALEEAHKELQDREQVLRALSNRMAEERQDEREKIAAYLHDDLAQLLFKLSLQVDIARRHLAAGKVPDTERILEEIKDTKNKTSDRIRALIRDLHRSPLGRAGLAEALQGFIDETARGAGMEFHTDIDEVTLPPPIALLVYHIAREGVMNALKHANASNMWITVKQEEEDIVSLVLRDDGGGFDPEAPAPEGHYGLTMMRERALVGGGTYELSSAPGEGTTISVRFPTSWLQQETPRDGQQPPGGASPGTEPVPEGESAPQSVLA